LAVDVHGATAANTLTAAPAESQSGILLVLDPDKSIQDHGARLVEVDVVGLHVRLLGGRVWVPPVDLERSHVRGLLSRCVRDSRERPGKGIWAKDGPGTSRGE
jgi:hypothetical protein